MPSYNWGDLVNTAASLPDPLGWGKMIRERGDPEPAERQAHPFALRLLSPSPAGRIASLPRRLGLKASGDHRVSRTPAPGLPADWPQSLEQGFRWGNERANPSLKLSSLRFLRKPRNILANAGFYLNFGIFMPRFQAPPGLSQGELCWVWD